jgi:TonB family protein
VVLTRCELERPKTNRADFRLAVFHSSSFPRRGGRRRGGLGGNARNGVYRNMMRFVIVIGVLVAGQSVEINVAAQSQSPPPSVCVWSAITPAVPKTTVEPVWPNPRLNDTHGIIILDVWIDESGDVAFVQIVRSIPVNDAAAINAVRQWKFAPALRGGQPIAVVQQVRLQKP